MSADKQIKTLIAIAYQNNGGDPSGAVHGHSAECMKAHWDVKTENKRNRRMSV